MSPGCCFQYLRNDRHFGIKNYADAVARAQDLNLWWRLGIYLRNRASDTAPATGLLFRDKAPGRV